MSDQPYKPYLDQIFDDSIANLLDELASKNGGSFTSQDVIKAVARKKSLVYIDLLASAKAHLIATKGQEYANRWTFNEVHQELGKGLSNFAKQLGYEKHNGKRDEVDIFGNPTKRVTYQRTDE